MITYIRHFQDEDFSRLLEIDQECFEPGIAYDAASLRYFLYYIESHAVVLVSNSAVVGFGIASSSRTGRGKLLGHIIALDLDSRVRGQGHGKALLRHLEQILSDDGAAEVTLEVDIRNTAAIGFYLRMGYKKVRELRHYYGEGRSAYQMVRPLLE